MQIFMVVIDNKETRTNEINGKILLVNRAFRVNKKVVEGNIIMTKQRRN